MALHLKFATPTRFNDGDPVPEAEVDADRILIVGDRLHFLRKGEVLGETSVSDVSEIELEKPKSFSVEQVRTQHARAYLPWTKESEEQLLQLHGEGMSPEEIGRRLERQPSAIQSRLRRLQGR